MVQRARLRGQSAVKFDCGRKTHKSQYYNAV
jgi:hypothetical protein